MNSSNSNPVLTTCVHSPQWAPVTMEGFGDYESDEGSDVCPSDAAPAPVFKPAWEAQSDEDDEDEPTAERPLEEKPSLSPASAAPAQPPAKKKKILPSALDALSSAAPTFLSKV